MKTAANLNSMKRQGAANVISFSHYRRTMWGSVKIMTQGGQQEEAN
jgi:hypothetical protein